MLTLSSKNKDKKVNYQKEVIEKEIHNAEENCYRKWMCLCVYVYVCVCFRKVS